MAKDALKTFWIALALMVGAGQLAPIPVGARISAAPEGGLQTKTTFVRLSEDANAILVEPVTPDPVKSRIALLVTREDRMNNFNYFIGDGLPKYGYRVMMLNYYGTEQTYYELYAPVAAAIKALRAIPGVEKVVLAGHSTGGPELTSYEDVAENGPGACKGSERIYKCESKGLENLPRADGMILLDADSGAPWKMVALNPAVDPHHSRQLNSALDMFSPKNGYDGATRSANYSPEFMKNFFEAQGARANQLTDEAQLRLEKIEKGEGEFKDDEPFLVPGWSLHGVSGFRLEIADTRLLSKTHSPHMLLKADGSRPVEVIPSVMPPKARPEGEGQLFQSTFNTTVRHYLSYQAMRVKPDYAISENNITGFEWRSSPNSVQGNIEGIHVPSLFMPGTCSEHLVFLEIAYDLSPAKDKEMVGVEGAEHNMEPCRPEYGDTTRRAFDFVDSWLSKKGRFEN